MARKRRLPMMGDDFRHVVLLSADALRADHLSCYGYDRDTTPVLDDLASDCLRFESAYSASSHTREAVPALLTGEYPDRAADANFELADESVAQTLSSSGFATGAFHSNPFISRAYGYDRGFDHFFDDLHFGRMKAVALVQRALDKLRNRHYARASEINQRSLRWIDSLEDGQPFFLWNHYMDTHGPYEPPPEFAECYVDEPVSSREAQSLFQRAVRNPDSIAESERRLLVNLYDAEIRYNDARIGDLLDGLRKRGLLERTLLIVTSDHGEAFGERGYYEHPRYLHEELTHVPLLVRAPGASTGSVETPVSLLDVVPTVEHAVGISDSDKNTSLLAPPDGDRTVFMQARGEGEAESTRRFAARTREAQAACEYHVHAGSVTFDDADRTLRTELEAFVRNRQLRVGDGESSDDTSVDPEIDRRLNALGYKD